MRDGCRAHGQLGLHQINARPTAASGGVGNPFPAKEQRRRIHTQVHPKEEKMKRSKLSAIVVISLTLSLQAQSAHAASTKSPLSAAEYAQCEVQRNEFNQRVRAFNADLDQINVLNAEIDALRVEIDKDEVAIDQRDNAAVKALNERIGKNNDLVARIDQMSTSLKAKKAENNELGAQYREACKDRPVARAPSPSPAPQVQLQAQVSDPACSSASGAKGVQRKVEATFAEMRVDQKKREAEVERVAEARAKAQSWSAEKRGKVWLQVLMSPKFMAFEREKQPYVEELMRVIGSKPKNNEEECRTVQRIAAMMPAIKAINARQYAFMADEIRVAK
jgi:hypothetical protein